ncbi:hypothetical protein [Sphingopyxis sp. R3-92]|uniref:hypothetical protein n=1 Tax=Sphingopyxis sp. R3-92 TaxID=3158553 RepID=UPI003EE80256
MSVLAQPSRRSDISPLFDILAEIGQIANGQSKNLRTSNGSFRRFHADSCLSEIGQLRHAAMISVAAFTRDANISKTTGHGFSARRSLIRDRQYSRGRCHGLEWTRRHSPSGDRGFLN